MYARLEKRLQVLLDEARWRRLSAYAAERNLSVGAVVRDALDKAIPASRDERRSAARRILSAESTTTRLARLALVGRRAAAQLTV